MASYVPPKRATAWVGYTALLSTATGEVASAPTLAAGDVTISKDGGAFANLTTLPDVYPAAGKAVRIRLSATEMTADNIIVVFADQTAPAEWDDQVITLQTAAQQVDDLATPVQIAAQVAAALTGTALTITRGDTLSQDFSGLGSLAARTKLHFTVKASYREADTAAIIQIEETAGLLYLNGAAATSAAAGDILVTDAATGALTITLTAAATAALSVASNLVYDLQQETASAVTTLTAGTCAIAGDVTRAVT
jgi:hypothetical protein